LSLFDKNLTVRVVVPGGEGVGGAKKKDKEYELSAADDFWLKHKGSPFPQVQ
jgi:hypothetical protein